MATRKRPSPSATTQTSRPGLGCLTVLLLTAALALGFYAMNWDWLNGTRTTVYQTVCRGEMVNGECEGGWERMPPMTFLVSMDQQSVVKQITGVPPQRLQNCAVVDKRNWRCTVAGQVSERFTDGIYELVYEESSGPTPIVLDGTRVVPRYQWLWARSAR